MSRGIVRILWLLSMTSLFFIGPTPALTADLEPVKEINFTSFPQGQQQWVYQQALMIVENWEKLGLKVRLEPLNIPNPLIQRVFKDKDFDATMMEGSGTVDRLDPDFFLYTVFHSSNAGPGAWNLAGFNDPEYDRLAEAQRLEYDLNKRREIVHKCQEVLFNKNPWLVTVNNNSIQAYNQTAFKAGIMPVSGFYDAATLTGLQPLGEKKTFRYGSSLSDLKTINPVVFNESDQFVFIYSIYDTLVRNGPDGKPELWAAKTLEKIDDKNIDLTLREGLKFHDGQPLRAEDVKFTFEYLTKHKAVYLLKKLEPIEAVEVLGEYKVRFKMKTPYAPFISLTLGTTPIIPKHIWEKIDKPHEYRNVPPIGSGPFKFGHWRETQEFLMTRNADHFSPPQVDAVLFVFYGTTEAVNTALKKQEVDSLNLLTPQQVMDLEKQKHIKIVNLPTHTTDGVILNIRRKPFDDPKFRQALAYTLPKVKMVEEIFFGYAEVGASIIAPHNEFWHNPKIKPYPHDLEKARSILKEAGYRWDEKGRLCHPPK
ncbi:MAG: ABC transporter substrate-binding protein [Thermodesulfobacteriota bacterium]